MNSTHEAEAQSHLLIVDDIQANLAVLQKMLSRAGYQVYVADNGKQAMEILRSEPMHLIISDILMPVMDGYDLCRQCQQDEDLSHIPFIFYTATYTTDDDRAFGLSLGAARFIIKPAEHKAFLREIAEVLGEAREKALHYADGYTRLSETVYEREHNIRLVHKLEQKLEQLEQANRLLQEQITEGDQLRQALAESEERYRILSDSAAIPVYLVQDSRFQYVNQAFLDASGYKADEVIGKMGPLDMLTADSRPIMAEEIRKRLGGEGASSIYSCQGYTKQGEIVDLEIHGAVANYRGKPAMIGSLLNITERRRAESALRNSEARLNEAQKLAQVGSWELDIMTGRLECSDEVCRIFEMDQDKFDASYEVFIETIHPDDRKSVHLAYKKSLETQQSCSIEHRLLFPDGRIKWVHEQRESIFAEDGTPLAALGTVQDITMRKETETILKESEARFRQLAENVDAVFWMRSAEGGQQLYVSPKFETIWGHRLEMLRQNPDAFMDTVHAEDRPALRAAFGKLAAGVPAEHYNIEYRIVRPEGEVRWIHDRGFSIRDQMGEIIRQAGFAEDITERRKIALELQQYRGHLEDLVESRTYALAEANQHLQDLDRLKSMFIASMSHELRTPMNSILGFTDLILQGLSGEINDLQRDQLQRVHGAGKHLLLLISDIIDLSKVEAGKVVALPRDFELADLLDEAVENNLIEARRKGLNLVLQPLAHGILMHTDRQRLMQCLLNLISNALKYSKSGDIHVSAQQLGDEIIIAVKDSGIGISGDDKTKLFQPFVRFDSDLMVKAGGTGLGLYLTRKLMTELLNGSISVESEAGVGSCFSLRLPCRLQQVSGDRE